jgi:hypothetical protein
MVFRGSIIVLPKKAIAVTLAILIIATPLLAQEQMEDVVYLKDGTIIRGQIIEQVPNVSIKVQTKDGSVFVYKMEDVLKITKEPLKETLPEKKDEGYLQGKIDGSRDAKGNALWFCAGSPALLGVYGAGCLGCIGPVVAYLAPPGPPAAKLVGKSPEYALGYTEAYKSKTKTENTIWASVGCTTFLGVAVAIVLARGGIIGQEY